MKSKVLWVPVVLLVAVVGCTNKATTTTSDGKTVKLEVPKSVTVKPDKDGEVTVKLTGADKEGTIEFENLPDGVKVKEPTKFKAGDKEVTFHLHQEGDLKEQKDHEVKVSATVSGAKVGPEVIKVTVEK